MKQWFLSTKTTADKQAETAAKNPVADLERFYFVGRSLKSLGTPGRYKAHDLVLGGGSLLLLLFFSSPSPKLRAHTPLQMRNLPERYSAT